MLDDIIRPIAHRLWLVEGRPDGKAIDHWLEARKLALSSNLAQPWYDPSAMAPETEWMQRTLWHPQHFSVS